MLDWRFIYSVSVFALVTRWPYCPWRPKELCFTTGNHGGEAWRGKTKLFWSPGTIWPPSDKGELPLVCKANLRVEADSDINL